MVIIVTLRENKTYYVERKLGVTVSATHALSGGGMASHRYGARLVLDDCRVGREGRGRGAGSLKTLTSNEMNEKAMLKLSNVMFVNMKM